VLRETLGREYPIVIGGERITAPQKFSSFNPSRSAEVVGVFQKGDADIAGRR
jgi:1-pyrroline-5-carboxylate dehydrogenase